MKKWLTWVPAILIMIMIYYFSSKPAEISGQESMVVTDYIYTVYESFSGRVGPAEERAYTISLLEHIIRKAAHMTEYAMLALALAWPFRKHSLKGLSLTLATMGSTVFYAMSDEFHQTFVPGRSGEIRDVIIDSIGAVIGYLIFTVIYKKLHKKANEAAN